MVKSMTELAPEDTVSAVQESAKEGKRKKKKKSKEGKEPAPKDTELVAAAAQEQENEPISKAERKPKGKKALIVEVVLDALPPPRAAQEPKAVPKELLKESRPVPPAPNVPPKPAIPDHLTVKNSRPSTPTMSTPTLQGRGSVPYWRRPNSQSTLIAASFLMQLTDLPCFRASH